MVWVVPMARAMFDRCGVVLGGGATLPDSIKRAFATRITTPHTRRSCALRPAPNAMLWRAACPKLSPPSPYPPLHLPN